MKDYLAYENSRNKTNHELYQRFIRKAVGADADVLVVHHVTYKRPGHEPNEIPSADTMMFCHDLMEAVFGDYAMSVMSHLARTPAEMRDDLLGRYLSDVEARV